MFKNLILTAWINLKRKKMVSLFTLLTITLGMTLIVLLTTLINSFTGNVGPYTQRNKCLYLSNISYVENGKTFKRHDLPHATSTFISKHLSKLKTPALVGLYGRSYNFNLGSRYKKYKGRYLETDANFWKIHKFTFLHGRPFSQQDIINKEKVCILSQKAALYFFQSTNIVGKMYNNFGAKLRVVGVIKDEHPHHQITADLYKPYTLTIWDENTFVTRKEGGEKEYYNRGAYIGVILAKNASDIPAIRKEYQKLQKGINNTGQVDEYDNIKATLQRPYQLIQEQLHIDNYNEGMFIFCIFMAIIFLMVPVLILSNINTYSLRDRLEEIGLKKAFGATRKDLFKQFLTENILLTIVGCMAAIVLSIPVNKWLCAILYGTSNMVSLPININTIIYLILGSLLFGFLTGVVPVYRISKILPVMAISQNMDAQNHGWSWRLRKKGLQIATYSLLFVVLTLSCFIISISYFKHLSPLGYKTKNIISMIISEGDISTNLEQYNQSRFKNFKESLITIPQVTNVSYVMENPPFYRAPQYKNYILNNTNVEIRTLEADTSFFSILNIHPIKGKLFNASTPQTGYIPAVITRLGEEKYFQGNAINKTITLKEKGKKVKIIGVIHHYKHHSYTKNYNGLFLYRNLPSRSVLIKYKPNTNLTTLEKNIKGAIKNQTSANVSYFQNDVLHQKYLEMQKGTLSTLYAVLLAMSFLLLSAFMGYFILSWYNVKVRQRELGVRRAMGATRGAIRMQIIKEQITLMFIGSVIAAALVFQFLWIIQIGSAIHYYWIGLAFATVVAIVMTIASTILPACKAATINPIKALCQE